MMASRSKDLNVIATRPHLWLTIRALEIIPDLLLFVQACFPSGAEMGRVLRAA